MMFNIDAIGGLIPRRSLRILTPASKPDARFASLLAPDGSHCMLCAAKDNAVQKVQRDSLRIFRQGIMTASVLTPCSGTALRMELGCSVFAHVVMNACRNLLIYVRLQHFRVTSRSGSSAPRQPVSCTHHALSLHLNASQWLPVILYRAVNKAAGAGRSPCQTVM